MRFIQKSLLFLTILLPITAYACMPARISVEERAQHASVIYVGVVSKIKDMPVKQQGTGSIGITAGTPAIPQKLTVDLLETIKGDKKEGHIHPKLLDCGSGTAALKDKVIVYFDGEYWFTKVFEQKTYETLLNIQKHINQH